MAVSNGGEGGRVSKGRSHRVGGGGVVCSALDGVGVSRGGIYGGGRLKSLA